MEHRSTFVSDVSHKTLPWSQRVTGKAIRQCILEEIQKDYPTFNEHSVMSLLELNVYRNRYIQESVTKELGTLSGLEQKVVEAMQNDEILSDKLNEGELKELPSHSQRLADKVASFGGSWKFIILFTTFIVIWMGINVVLLYNKGFDPYPFILLNLILSCIAALQAPVIMMSQNRQEEKDRERARNDYMINLKSELEIRLLHEKIDHLVINQQEKLLEIQQIQMDLMSDILRHLEKKMNH
ncbi:DUF1003 domain-containing protein [Deminuibacter soli]|uniref:DUF1003 domain-containing protein n=1 Tax=Deminuibacter soli TaxID=2291815 RepID=A0A3E1NRN6_9BACT|nr:DUF1003 domain-containing protein [Deminuibacter soli]RFM30428.1 DUF1003 domain-containing protein [Deminuibacter soli]